MNKIVFVIPSMVGGGAERVIASLSNELVDRGIDITILMTSGVDVEYVLSRKVEIVCIGSATGGSPIKTIDRLIKLRKFILSNAEAGYICMETNTNIYMLLSSIGINANIIVSERCDPNEYNHKIMRDIVYNFLVRKIVYQTQDAKNYYNLSKKVSARVIANPIRDNLPEIWRGERKKTIVAIGRLEPQKNYHLLLRAFAAFLKTEPEYSLNIYGKGYQESELIQLAEKLDISHNVVFKGFEPEPWSEARKDGIYILTSDFEGMPNSLIEAMAMGMPVISTDCPIGGPKELIENGTNGLLVPIKDEEALNQALSRMVQDEGLCYRMSKEAMSIREKLSIKNITDQWLELLEK